eukprot:gene10451-12809_t
MKPVTSRGARRGQTLAAALCSLVLAAAPAAAQVKWDMSMEDRANSLPGEGATAFAEDVAKSTGGQVVITVHHGGALGFKNKDHLNAVRDGVLPLAQSLAGAFSGQEPVFLLSSLPFVARNLDEAKVLYDVARSAYEAALARNGQKLLYSSPFPPTGIWANEIENGIRPEQDAFSRVLARHLGQPAPDDETHRLAFSIASMALMLMMAGDVVKTI